MVDLKLSDNGVAAELDGWKRKKRCSSNADTFGEAITAHGAHSANAKHSLACVALSAERIPLLMLAPTDDTPQRKRNVYEKQRELRGLERYCFGGESVLLSE